MSRETSAPLGEAVALHALSWWFIGGAAGWLMASLLVVPELSRYLGPFSYGRWAPVHLNLTLYGALALPWVGVLLAGYEVGAEGRGGRGRWALAVWSAGLAVGTVSWLSGRSSGKLFLDWSGPAKWLFLVALAVLAVVLLEGQLRRRDGRQSLESIGLWVLWAALAWVPWALSNATKPSIYPPINPASGGPTGNSLLGSSLGLVLVIWLAPRLLGLARRSDTGVRWLDLAIWTSFGLQALVFVALGTGDHSHREVSQWAALASVAVWGVWIPLDYRRFHWPPGSRPWCRIALVWGAVLLADGILQFLPGPLQRGKFTHLLVGHAHLAMAGFAAAVSALLLHVGLSGGARAAVFDDRPAFLLWNGGTVLHCSALFALGALEAMDPSTMLRGGPWIVALLWLRWLAGGVMLIAVGRWLSSVTVRGPA